MCSAFTPYTPRNRNAVESNGGVDGSLFPSLIGIFNQPRDVQRAMLNRASIIEIFHFYCLSEVGRYLILREPLPQKTGIGVSVNSNELTITVLAFQNLCANLTMKYELPVPGAEVREFTMERQFDDVRLELCKETYMLGFSIYYIRSANMRENFGKLVGSFMKIFGTVNSNHTIGYTFEETVVTETVKTSGSMPLTPYNLNYVLDYCMGNIPNTHILLNDGQSLGLVSRSTDFEQKNALASVDNVIEFVENIMRPMVWKDVKIELFLDKALLEGKEQILFRALDKFCVPIRLPQNADPDRVKKICNIYGSLATFHICRQSDCWELLEEDLDEDDIFGDILEIRVYNDGIDREEL